MNNDKLNGDHVLHTLVLNTQSLAEKVRITRLAKNLRQVDICFLCGSGISPEDISKMEKSRPLKLKKKLKILKALGLVEDALDLIPVHPRLSKEEQYKNLTKIQRNIP